MKGTLTNGLLHSAQSFPCLQYFTVLPSNYNSLQHSQHLSCKASLVEIRSPYPTHIDGSCKSILFDDCCTCCVSKEKSIPAAKCFQCDPPVCESRNLQSTEHIRPGFSTSIIYMLYERNTIPHYCSNTY